MALFRFRHVAVDSYALHLPETVVTSAEIEDRIGALYQRLEIPFGTLEKLSGVRERRLWEPKFAPSKGATAAAEAALEKSTITPDKLQVLFNCSVTRDYFEPGTACLVGRNIGLPERSMAMDISNACLGFSNGLILLGQMIESGIVKAGLVVSGESVSSIVESTIAKIMKEPNLTRAELVRLLPVFTLGGGAAAAVLCHESIAREGAPRLMGAAVRSATQHNDLCVGDRDYCILQDQGLDPLMFTDSSKLIPAAADLGSRVWKDLSEASGVTSEQVDHIFCHQVGKQVNNAFYQTMGLDMKKEFTVYQELGNLVSASMPAALFTGAEKKPLRSGDTVLTTAFGSGLNAIFSLFKW